MNNWKIIARVLGLFLLCNILVLTSTASAMASNKFQSPDSNLIMRKAIGQSIRDCYQYAARREFKYEDYRSFGATHSTYKQMLDYDFGNKAPSTGEQFTVTSQSGSDSYKFDVNYFGGDVDLNQKPDVSSAVATYRWGVMVLDQGDDGSSGGNDQFQHYTLNYNSYNNSRYDDNISKHFINGSILTGLLPHTDISGIDLSFREAYGELNGIGNGLARLPQGWAGGLKYIKDEGYGYASDLDDDTLLYDTTYMCEDFFSDKTATDSGGNTIFAGVFTAESTGAKEEFYSNEHRTDAETIAKFLNQMGYSIDLPAKSGYCARFQFMAEHHDVHNFITTFYYKEHETIDRTTDLYTKSICIEYVENSEEILNIYQRTFDNEEPYEGVYYEVDSDGKGFTVYCDTRSDHYISFKSTEGCGDHFGEQDIKMAKSDFVSFSQRIADSLTQGEYTNVSDIIKDFGGWTLGTNYTIYVPQTMNYRDDEEVKTQEINGSYDLARGIQVENLNYLDATFKLSDPGGVSALMAASYLFEGGTNAGVGNTTQGNASANYVMDGLTETEKEVLYRHYLLDFYGAADSTYCINPFGSTQQGQQNMQVDAIKNMVDSKEDLASINLGSGQPALLTYQADGSTESTQQAQGKEFFNINNGKDLKGDYYELVMMADDGYYYQCYSWPSQNLNYGVFGVYNDNRFFKYVLFDELIKYLQNAHSTGDIGKPNPEVTQNTAMLMALDKFDSSIEEQRDLDCYGHDDEHEGLGLLSLLFCPILDHASKAIQGAYTNVIEKYIKMPADMYGSGTPVEKGWRRFNGLANAMLGMWFILMIVSQVTGWRSSAYGIRAMLPRWILWTILANISFMLCGMIMDLATIVANSAQSLMAEIVSGALDGKAAAPFAVKGGEPVSVTKGAFFLPLLVGGILVAAIIITKGGVLVSLLSAFFSAVVALFGLFLYMGIRQAALLLLVAVSPVAFAMGVMPNTHKIFKSWMNVFVNLVMVFPICSFLVYGGDAASKLMVLSVQLDPNATNIEFSTILELVAAVICAISPIFMLPSVVKSATLGMHQLASSIGGSVGRAMGRGVFAGSSVANAGANGARMIGQRAMGAFRTRSVFARNRMAAYRAREDRFQMRALKYNRNHAVAQAKKMQIGDSVRKKLGFKPSAPLSQRNMAVFQNNQQIAAYDQHMQDLAGQKYEYLQSMSPAALETKYRDYNNDLADKISKGKKVKGTFVTDPLTRAQNELTGALSGGYNHAEAMAALSQLQGAEEYGLVNEALLNATSGAGLQITDATNRSEFLQALSGTSSANAPAGLYAQYLQSSGRSDSFDTFMTTQFGDYMAKGGVELLVSQDKESLASIVEMAENSPIASQVTAQLEKITDDQIKQGFERMNFKQQKQFGQIVSDMSQTRREQLVDSLGIEGISKLTIDQVRAINRNTKTSAGVARPSQKIIEAYLNATPTGSTKTRAQMIKDDPAKLSSIDMRVRKELGLV